MRYLKMLGLAAVAAAGLMAFIGASTASATELYSGATTLKTGTTFTPTVEGTWVWETTEGSVLNTCTSGSLKGKTTNNGSSTETVKANIEELAFTSCTEGTATLSKGGLEIHYTSGLNGTVTSINGSGGAATEVTVNTTIFGSCVFVLPSGTTLGTLTGSTTSNDVLDGNAVATRKSGLCPATLKWTWTWTTTIPSPMHVTAS